jgi:hypothetical protein
MTISRRNVFKAATGAVVGGVPLSAAAHPGLGKGIEGQRRWPAS